MLFRRRPAAPTALEQPAPRPEPVAIREFIYLDEVSVVSLSSAAGQPLLVGEHETNGHELENNAAIDGGISTPIAKVGAKVGTRQGFTTALQSESQYNIQSTFAALLELVAPRTVLRSTSTDEIPIPFTSVDLISSLDALKAAGAAATIGDLSRGTLIEVPIELVPHDSYTVRSVVSEMTAMSQAAPTMLDLDTGEMSVSEVADVMNWLLGDLVPIQGRSTCHELLDIGGQTWVIESRFLKNVRTELGPARPLTVAGTTQSALYWKDIRRTVFAGQEYTVLGRIARPGIHPTWNAVKTLGALQRAIDDDKFVATLNRAFDLTTRDAGAAETLAWAVDYYTRLGTAYGTAEPNPAELLQLAASVPVMDQQTLSERSATLRRLADLFAATHTDTTRDLDLEAQCRAETLQDHGLLLPTTHTGTHEVISDETASPDILELEIIAAYW